METNVFSHAWEKRMIAIVGLVILGSCSQEPSGVDGPGQCSLQCSNAVISSPTYEIEPPSSGSVRCRQSDTEITLSMPFHIRKNVKGGDGFVMVPNVSFRPNTLGNVTSTTIEGSSFPGIQTKDDQLCSDSCGVARFSVSMPCPETETSEVRISISSGALASEPSIITLIADEKVINETTNTTTSTTTGSDTATTLTNIKVTRRQDSVMITR